MVELPNDEVHRQWKESREGKYGAELLGIVQEEPNYRKVNLQHKWGLTVISQCYVEVLYLREHRSVAHERMLEYMKYVGQNSLRVDGGAKITGQALFLDDRPLSSQALVGKMLTSPFPHADIRAINIERAFGMPGVKAVATGQDIPQLHGECLINIPFLAQDRVRYVGEPVAAVAATTEEAAIAALAAIEVEYEPRTPVLDPEDALKEDAPLLHPKLGEYRHISAITPVSDSNVCNYIVEKKGDVDSAFAGADWCIEGKYTTHHVQHAALEPHGAIAQVDEKGKITLWSQNDSPHRARKELAEALNLAYSDVRVISGYVGGNYGGKGGLKAEAIAVSLALKVSPHPVKVIFDRQEVFSSTIARVPATVWIKSAGTHAGIITARKVKIIFDCGAYAEKTPTIALNASPLASGPYDIDNVEIESFTVFTNRVVTGAMRGYGSPQMAWAYESHTDEIATSLEMDPIDLRRRNILREGARVVTGQRLHAVGLDETLEKSWQAASTKSTPSMNQRSGTVRGVGVACMYRTVKTPSVSAAWVKMEEDGSIAILAGSVEVGQGVRTVLSQIAAETLRLPLARIYVSEADTDIVPYDTSTTSSRSTFHMGNAVKTAAEEVKEKLLNMAAELWGLPFEEVSLSEGKVLGSNNQSAKYSEIIAKYFGIGAGGTILGQAVFRPQHVMGVPEPDISNQEAYSNLSVFHSYATQIAEVEVDQSSGEVKVLRIIAAHDVGKAINPLACRQQIEGAVLMGLGYALTESYYWEEGILFNGSFVDYAIPTGFEAPLFETYLVEKSHSQGPYGAKGLGEMALAPTAPAIANAIYDACGVRIRELPITPTKIIAGLRQKQRQMKQ